MNKNLPVAEHWYGGPQELAALYIKLCIRNSRKFKIAVCPARSFSSCQRNNLLCVVTHFSNEIRIFKFNKILSFCIVSFYTFKLNWKLNLRVKTERYRIHCTYKIYQLVSGTTSCYGQKRASPNSATNKQRQKKKHNSFVFLIFIRLCRFEADESRRNEFVHLLEGLVDQFAWAADLTMNMPDQWC